VRGGRAFFQALLVIGVSCATAPRPALALPPHDSTTVTTNAYGDTVWFQTPVMHVGRTVVPAWPRADSSADRGWSAIAYARTDGTPVLIEMSEREPSPPAGEIVERALRQPRLGLLGGTRSPDDWGIATFEAGRFDNFEGRPLKAWEVWLHPEHERSMRLVFVVIGLAEAQIDTLDRPASIRNAHYLRPFEVPIPDRLHTARIVGEYRADLKRGRIEQVDIAGGPEK